MLSPVTSWKQIRVQFRLSQVETYVHTACESHDLNMDFCGFKQLLATISKQELALEHGFFELKVRIIILTSTNEKLNSHMRVDDIPTANPADFVFEHK